MGISKRKGTQKGTEKKSNNHWDFPKINDWWHAIDPKSLESTNHQKCTLSLSYSNLGNIKEKENILKKARWENPPYFYRKKKKKIRLRSDFFSETKQEESRVKFLKFWKEKNTLLLFKTKSWSLENINYNKIVWHLVKVTEKAKQK